MAVSILEVENLDVYYGAVHALKGVSLRAEAGEIVTLIGANGAGKTTLLRAISGLIAPRAGAIRFDGREIARSVVVLPAPLAPISVTTSPWPTVIDTPFSAWMPP